jgi:hypothetical protein
MSPHEAVHTETHPLVPEPVDWYALELARMRDGLPRRSVLDGQMLGVCGRCHVRVLDKVLPVGERIAGERCAFCAWSMS